MVDASRRGFLFARPRPVAPQQRPPWALPEATFVDACTRCGECVKGCPTGILVTGDGGYPTVNFLGGECTFCGDCLTACQPAALLRAEEAAPWRIIATISANCLAEQRVECRVCGDFCEARAIRFTPRLGACSLPEIDAGRCTGCGACVAPCPAKAIEIS